VDQPVIFAVDDEPAVLSAIGRDLRREYGGRFRLLRTGAGPAALEALRQLKLRDERVALLLVDQRMPEMTGVQFLKEALALFPDAKRVLLTAYADTDAAIDAINEIKLDHYLMKPWDPPEERLYPVLTDLLDEWQATFPPRFEGIRVVGHRWSAQSHRVRGFLAGNLIPYQWLDIEQDEEARQLAGLAEVKAAELPLVLFPDGSRLTQPSNGQLGERVGLKSQAGLPFYDLVIAGAGPAGLAAAVYAASEGLRTLLIEGEAPGGQAGTSSRIENYFGFHAGVGGGELARRAQAQARRFGAEILTPVQATGLRRQDPYRIVTLGDGSEVTCHALLIGTGLFYTRLDVPGAERLGGSGVYYGATITEAVAARDREVFVVGAGNSAGQGAMYLSKFARSVTMLVRGESLTRSLSQYLIAQIDATPNISVRTQTNVVEVRGETHVEEIVLAHTPTGRAETLPAHALFVFIGAMPRTDFVAGVVERDPRGFILSGPELTGDGRRPRGWTLSRAPYWLETSVPGVFVAGDVRHGSVKRVASAVGEGAMAVQFVREHLATLGAAARH
jgi:thioredoxin reductase (NADPH)